MKNSFPLTLPDDNECSISNVCGNGTCSNVEGGFECSCGDGFAPGPMQICEDVDECRERSHQCAFRCHNTLGSYKCACPYGYQLAPDGKHCNDVDECSTPANNCKFLCKNLIGSFMCICPEGYQQASVILEQRHSTASLCSSVVILHIFGNMQIGSGDDCRDINECVMQPNICQNGRCVNLKGSYRCECFDGYEPSSDYTKCIGKAFTLVLMPERKQGIRQNFGIVIR